MKNYYRLLCCCLVLMMSSIVFMACGVLDVRGKTFKYESVSIDWGMSDDEDKELIFEEFLVSNETELLNVLKTRNGRNQRVTTFGTDSKYTTVNGENEIVDSGYYKQDDDVITLADSEEGLSQKGNYTLKVNEKGYKTRDVINSELSVFAVYQYVVSE